MDVLTAISLEELNAAAELMTRVDRKYVVPAEAFGQVLALAGRASVLEIDGRREFGYASTYFDTADLTGFHAAAHRRRRRFKIRTRHYAESGACFVEVKTRGRRGTTVKERLLVDSSVARRAQEEPNLGLPGGARRFVAERLDAAMIADVDVDALGPVLHTTYRRSTLLLASSHTRLTIDRDLCWSAPGGSRAHAGELVVVETKTPSGTAPELDHGLWSLGIRPVRLSKYGAGMALLDPTRPANRWHRVIHRHLIPAVSRGAHDA